MINKKRFGASVAATAVALVFIPFLVARGDVNAAVSYLGTKSSNPWSSMAAVAAGQSPNVDDLKTVSSSKAIDLEAPILAIAAAGKDPRTFGATDLVASLKSFVSQSQIGDPTTLNDDIFGILAFSAAGVPSSDSAIAGAKTFLLQHQSSDGGWAFAVGGTSDTNTTAAAIMALLEAGVSSSDNAITQAVAYLKSAQNADGGFPYDPKSQYGTGSDASSDAWVISALNKIGIDPKTWIAANGDPVAHLLSLQILDGYFEYQKGSGEDSFSPVTTSYAVVALLGKSYPVAKITAPTVVAPTVTFRIEGKTSEFCAGSVAAINPMEVVKSAAGICNFTYHIQNTSLGEYLDQIGQDTAQGASGWLYLVNDASPSVGATAYNLKGGDDVLWYYGDSQWKPTRVILNAAKITSGASAQVTVESFASGSWSPLSGAIVHAGSVTAVTDANGKANLPLSDGTYRVFAEESGYIRSEQELLLVGQVSESSLNLSATIDGGSGGGGGPGSGGSVSFSVEAGTGGNTLSFGTIVPGSVGKQLMMKLKNTGQSKVSIVSNVSGDDVFRNYLSIDNISWSAYNVILAGGDNKNAEAELSIPANYGGTGAKRGSLIFWATPTQ